MPATGPDFISLQVRDLDASQAFYERYLGLVRSPAGPPGRGRDDDEFATMTYVDWFNHQRLHGEIANDATYTTPAEFEARYYRQTPTTTEAVTQ